MHSRRMKLIGSVMKGNYAPYLGAIFSTLVMVLIGYTTPLVLSVVLDSVLGEQPVSGPGIITLWFNAMGGKENLLTNLWLCGLTLVVLNLVNSAFQYFNGRWSAVASERIAKSIRDRLYNHLSRLDFNYHVKAKTGDLIQRCTSDVETVRRFLATQLVQIVRCVAMLVVALVILFPINSKLTWIAMATVPLIFAFSNFFFKLVMKRFRVMDEAEGDMSTTLQENLTGMRVVRAFGRQHYEIEKFDGKSADFRNKADHFLKLMAWYWSATDCMCMIQIGLVLIFGILMCVRGELSTGQLVVFVQYESMLLWPIRQLGRILADMGKSLVSLDRLDEILMEKPESDAPDSVEPPIDRDIVFNHVNFAYNDTAPVLRDLSLTIPTGKTVAILGATGTGKSTLVHLLQRLYEYRDGSITIGGVELNTIKKKWLREHIGIVLQEPFLYSKDIRENIRIVDPTLPEEKVFEAAQTACIHEGIQEFENGYDTVVGERGVTLSGGQKQRVAIARTLLKNNDVLIFDDSLSAVDTQTDAAIRQALAESTKQVTTVIISHRITTLSQADIIYVLEDGHVAQYGTHEELIHQDGLYKRICGIQNALESELDAV